MANLDKSGISSGGSITSTHVTNLYDALTGDTTYDNINLKKFNSLGINDDATSTKINITNTGLGIGVSPSTELHVSGNIFATGNITAYYSSDIRLKENVELIGKSPSNINIYKFNYKYNPTTYQGAMAHEVPWASVKHSNGYMMVDYNQIDVEFKKI